MYGMTLYLLHVCVTQSLKKELLTTHEILKDRDLAKVMFKSSIMTYHDILKQRTHGGDPYITITTV